MRYTVTGAAGFIGANLVARLKSQGHWVRAVDIKRTPHRAHLYEQADDLRLDCDLRRGDQGCAQGVDRVFHLAADHGGAGYFYSDADFKAANNNLTIDRNVLRAAMAAGVERLFFASSACTYPVDIQGVAARALRESDLGKGEGEQLYGAAKRMSTLLMEGAREHGIDARSGVFHTIYGPGQDYLEPRAKFPTALCRKLIEDPTRVEVWGDGTQVRTFLFIDDALDRIQTVIEEPYSGPVNVGSDEDVTVQQCAEWAAEAAGASPEWVYTDGPTGVAHRAADNTEWNARYGETPLTSARDGFARTYEWLVRELEPAFAKAA
jgi:GDP-D-mannose 3',5'-epimerase